MCCNLLIVSTGLQVKPRANVHYASVSYHNVVKSEKLSLLKQTRFQ